MKLGEVCIHGSLRRSCEICDLVDELISIESKLIKAKKALKDIQSHMGIVTSHQPLLLIIWNTAAQALKEIDND